MHATAKEESRRSYSIVVLGYLAHDFLILDTDPEDMRELIDSKLTFYICPLAQAQLPAGLCLENQETYTVDLTDACWDQDNS